MITCTGPKIRGVSAVIRPYTVYPPWALIRVFTLNNVAGGALVEVL